MQMEYILLFFAFWVLQCCEGGDYTLWICGKQRNELWVWECGPKFGTAIGSSFESWSPDSDPTDNSKDALALDDEGDFLYTSFNSDEKLQSIMCEVTTEGDCPPTWGRIIFQSDSCWKLWSRSVGFTWQEAITTCAEEEVLDEAVPYLCVISSEAEFLAIRDWLSAYLPLKPPKATTVSPQTTQYDTTTVYLEETSNADTTLTTQQDTTTGSDLTSGDIDTTTTMMPRNDEMDLVTTAEISPNDRVGTSADSGATSDMTSSDVTTPVVTMTHDHEVTSRHTDVSYLNESITPFVSTASSIYEVTMPPTGSNRTDMLPLLSLYVDNSKTPEGLEYLDPDKRAFAIGVGIVAILLMVAFAVLICVMDLPTFVRDFKKLRRNIRHFVKCKKMKGPAVC